MTCRTLSKTARDARKPRPPAELVGAMQETVHVESGKWRRPKSTKVRSCCQGLVHGCCCVECVAERAACLSAKRLEVKREG
jgi:hypothetical protein